MGKESIFAVPQVTIDRERACTSRYPIESEFLPTDLSNRVTKFTGNAGKDPVPMQNSVLFKEYSQ